MHYVMVCHQYLLRAQDTERSSINHMSTWARHLTPNCSQWTVYECVLMVSLPPDEQVRVSSCHQCMNVCEWMNVTCSVKEFWVSDRPGKRYKYRPLTIPFIITHKVFPTSWQCDCGVRGSEQVFQLHCMLVCVHMWCLHGITHVPGDADVKL